MKMHLIFPQCVICATILTFEKFKTMALTDNPPRFKSFSFLKRSQKYFASFPFNDVDWHFYQLVVLRGNEARIGTWGLNNQIAKYSFLCILSAWPASNQC